MSFYSDKNFKEVRLENTPLVIINGYGYHKNNKRVDDMIKLLQSENNNIDLTNDEMIDKLIYLLSKKKLENKSIPVKNNNSWNHSERDDNIFTGFTTNNCDVALYLGGQRVIIQNGYSLNCLMYLDNLQYHSLFLRLLPSDTTKPYSVTLLFDKEERYIRTNNAIENVFTIHDNHNYHQPPTVLRNMAGMSGFADQKFLENNNSLYFTTQNIEKIFDKIQKYNPDFLVHDIN